MVNPTFRFPDGRHGAASLTYVGPVPILCVEGAPEDMGQQVAELALRPAARILDYPLDLVAAQLNSRSLARLALPLLDRLGRRLLSRFPGRHRRELLALAHAMGDERRVVRGNTLFDLKNLRPWRLFGCSSLALSAARTRTSGPLLARNLDFFPLGYLHNFGLVTVYRGSGGRRFAAVGFPGSVGVFSGMNDVGLVAVTHEVFAPPGSGFNPRGEPFAATCRRVLETCATVDQAHAVFRATQRTTSVSVTVCDTTDQAVFELSPEFVVRRDTAHGAVACANHFLGPGGANLGHANPFDTIGRLGRLVRVAAVHPRFGADEAWAALGDVSQGELTVQSMIFEPRRLVVHVALGPGPVTAQEPSELHLADWF